MTNIDRKNITAPFKKIIAKLLLAVLIINAGLVSKVFAQCGSMPYAPFYSFDFDGQTTTNFAAQSSEHAVDMVVQPDGKMIVASRYYNSTNWDFALTRYNVNGSLDPTFGTGGISFLDFSNRTDLAEGIALLPNGKIVVAGSTCASIEGSTCDFALARFNSNGTRDVTFGALGRISTDFNGALDQGAKVAVQADGKIVVVGTTLLSAGNLSYAAARYNTTGSLDPTFSGDGRFAYSSGNYGASDLAIQPDGKIVVAGGGNGNFGAIRLNADGGRDLTFGPRGRVSVDFGGYDVAYSVALMPDGKVVLGGGAQLGIGDFNDSALVRLTANGMLDATFDGDGKMTMSLVGSNDYIGDIALGPSGQITALANMDFPQTYALVTYYPDSASQCYYVNSSYMNESKNLTAVALYGSRIYVSGRTSSQMTSADIFAAVFETDVPM